MPATPITAIITGAARGIGRCIAQTLIGQGAAVALVDVLEAELREAASAIGEHNGKAIAVPTDITDPDAVAEMAARVASELGPVNLLVNNAGTFSYIGPTWEADPETWCRDTRVNLFGSFLCSRAVLGGMVERGEGRIINMVSAGGVGDPHAHLTSYAVSKTALQRLTEGLAMECAPHGVKVFALAPPAITTTMTEFIAHSDAGRQWRPSFGEQFDRGFEHTPQMVADWCVRLASGEFDALAGRYIRVTDDPATLKANMQRIIDDDLRTLRIREL